uniref:SF3 helicase domain-containing protein n=1 Tax=Pericapritermes dicistro-like virus 2 TaxID=3032224 RepID=A0AAT9J9V8_9VIRU
MNCSMTTQSAFSSAPVDALSNPRSFSTPSDVAALSDFASDITEAPLWGGRAALHPIYQIPKQVAGDVSALGAKLNNFPQVVLEATCEGAFKIGKSAVRGACETAEDGLPKIIHSSAAQVKYELGFPNENDPESTDSWSTNIFGSDILNFALEQAEVMAAITMTDEWSVRIILSFNLVHRTVTYFKLGHWLKKIGKYLIHLLVKHCRAAGEYISHTIWDLIKSVLEKWGLRDVEIPEQPQARNNIIAGAAIVWMVKTCLDAVRTLATNLWRTHAWKFMRARLEKEHYHLFMLLEGNRFIRNAGGPTWLHKHPNNALVAARVLHFANLTATQYETCHPPIDKNIIKDAIIYARNSSVAAASMVNGNRAGSVVVYMVGPTRQGKTYASQMLSNTLCKAHGAPAQTAFTFPISSQFRDGYVGNLVVLLSDAFRLADKADRKPEADFIMKAHDTDPFPLDMSKAEEKGTVFFNSPYVIATSNVDLCNEPATNVGLADKDALLSRMDFYLRCRCNDFEILTTINRGGSPLTIIDDVKVAEKYPLGAPSSIYTFERVDVLTGESLGDLSFDQLANLMQVKHQQRMNRFLGYTHNIPWDQIDELIKSMDTDNVPTFDFGVQPDVPDVDVERQAGRPGPARIRTAINTGEFALFEEHQEDDRFVKTWRTVVGDYYAAHPNPPPNWRAAKVIGEAAEARREANAQPRSAAADAEFAREYATKLDEVTKACRIYVWVQRGLTLVTMGIAGMQLYKYFRACKEHEKQLTDHAEKLALIRKVARYEQESGTKLVDPGEQPEWTPEGPAYEFDKVVKPRAISYRPKGPSPVVQHAREMAAKLEKLEDFVCDELELDEVVHKQSDIVVEPGDTGPHIFGCLSQPFIRQGCDNMNALQMAGTTVMHNLYWCELDVPRLKTSPAAQVFVLAGTVIVMPLHLGVHMYGCNGVYLYGNGTYFFENEWVEELACLPDAELAVFRIKRSGGFPEHRSMFKKFAKNSDLGFIGTKVMAATRLFDNDHSAAYFGSSRCQILESDDVDFINDHCNYKIAQGFQYPMMQTFNGMCGSPIICMEGSLVGKIVGFHVAGKSCIAGGVASIVTYEMLAKYHPPELGKENYTTVPPDVDNMEACGTREWGVIPANMLQVQNKKTSLRPSPLYGIFGRPTVEPSTLDRVFGICPLITGQKKWFGPSITPPMKQLDVVSRSIYLQLMSVMCRFSIPMPKKLTWLEAANTVPAGHERINLESSPGFPYNKMLQGSKRAWLQTTSDGTITMFHPYLVERMSQLEEEIAEGRTPHVVFRDSLKDEKRPTVKVLAGLTRVFSGAPLDYIIVFRSYFVDAAFRIQQCVPYFPVSVGVNPHGPDWGLMWREFERIPGDNWINGDCKNFDGTVPSAITLRNARGIFVPLLENGATKAQVMALMRAIAHALHVSGNRVYKLSHGVPSGTPITSLVDSIALLTVFMLAWLNCGYELTDFWIYVVIYVYGDDSLAKVHPKFEKFHQLAIAEFMEKIGMKFTSADKVSTLGLYTSRGRISYLQREFVKRDGIVFAPLPMAKIDDIPNWVRGSPQVQTENMKAEFKSFCEEYSHHPKDVYDVKTAHYQTELAKVGIVVDVPPFEAYLKRYL